MGHIPYNFCKGKYYRQLGVSKFIHIKRAEQKKKCTFMNKLTHTYCKGSESHTHSSKAIKGQSNENQNGQI